MAVLFMKSIAREMGLIWNRPGLVIFSSGKDLGLAGRDELSVVYSAWDPVILLLAL